jgi:hypothetical protein
VVGSTGGQKILGFVSLQCLKRKRSLQLHMPQATFIWQQKQLIVFESKLGQNSKDVADPSEPLEGTTVMAYKLRTKKIILPWCEKLGNSQVPGAKVRITTINYHIISTTLQGHQCG